MNNTIICTDEPNAVTVKITGKAFDNLKRIAEIFNAWDENDLTPAELLYRSVIAPDDSIMTLDEPKPDKYATTLPGSLCDAYGDAPDVEELRKAFIDAGFAIQS
jgi:hypothetical protein